MFTVRIGEKDLQVQDLPTLSAMMKAGQVQPDSAVYDHEAGAWRTVGAALAPPVGTPTQATLPPESSVPPPSVLPPTGAPMPPVAYPPGYPKTTPGTAIWSLVLSLVGLFSCMLLGVVGIVLGYKARAVIDANQQQLQGRGLATAGIVLGWIQVAIVPLAGLLALIAVPNFISLRGRAYDSVAQSAGFNAKIAEEVLFESTGGEGKGHYTDNLAELLVWDKNLTDDPGVTFVFGRCNSQGYTFTTKHKDGTGQSYTFTD
jgi:hypothetical protein